MMLAKLELIISHGTLETASVHSLLIRAKQGEEEAFKALFELYKSRVYSRCLAITHVRRDAEEVTADVFLTLVRNLPACKGERDFLRKMDSLPPVLAVRCVRRKAVQMGGDSPLQLFGKK